MDNSQVPLKNNWIDFNTPLKEGFDILHQLEKTSLTEEQNKFVHTLIKLKLQLTETLSSYENKKGSRGPMASPPNPLHSLETIISQGKGILLVSDKSKSYEKIKEYLNEEKCNIEEVQSDDAAIKQVLKSPKDSIALEIPPLRKRNFSGYKLAALLKSMPSTKDIKIVLWRCAFENYDGENIDALGIPKLLPHPLEKEDIIHCLKSIFTLADAPSFALLEHKESAVNSNLQQQESLGPKILIVEDGFIHQKLVTSILKNNQISYDLVKNGLEALNICKINDYALIFMDCQMPVMDGYDSTKGIRKFEGSDKHTCIVAMTANAMEGDREKCIAAGMDDYLSKPINFYEFLTKIEYYTNFKRNL